MGVDRYELVLLGVVEPLRQLGVDVEKVGRVEVEI
jgi:hypothetical protein